MLTQLTLCAQSETMARSMDMLLAMRHASRATHAYTSGMPRYAKPGKRSFAAPMRRLRA